MCSNAKIKKNPFQKSRCERVRTVNQRVQYTAITFLQCRKKHESGTGFLIRLHVRPAKTQVSLLTDTVSSESSQYALWVAEGPMHLQADNEDSDQTSWLRRLTRVFPERTCNNVENAKPRVI